MSRLADVGAAGRTHRKGGWSDDFRQIGIGDVSESPASSDEDPRRAYVEAGSSAGGGLNLLEHNYLSDYLLCERG